ncbi:ABC-2 type transport system permease protein [Catenuloplanes nepalensis]|uniref:ABC-2 type transport system permease protein n=1 Tax=Catenuloplanes nepalensis TaxID=587533 RepID=A0ABT9MK96_9ACTN|nr:ABC-2 family transporter protein [Catenuloplanes nepalensis]MDP9791834.1 ABC-2 type transport system permease protein [Catenuloplanes nepalensis]
MGDLRARLGGHLHLLRAQARSQASYRVSFAIDLITNVSGTALDVTTVFVLFTVTESIGGFRLPESLVMVGFGLLAFNLADLTVGNIERIRQYVRTGLMDAVLIRPLGPLGQLLAMDLPLRKASRCVLAASVLVVALARADIDWTPARLLLAVATPIAGTVFFGSIFVGTASVAFWWIESGEFGSAFTYGGRDFTSYPITVYGGWFRAVFAYGLGFGFVAYQPALALFGRADPLGLPAWAGWAAPLVCVPAALAAGLVWRTGIRHYRSTGS